MTVNTLKYLSFPSPLGWILVASDAQGLCFVRFCGPEEPHLEETEDILRAEFGRLRIECDEHSPLLNRAKDAILNYLRDGTPFPRLPLNLAQGTPFQRQVWNALCEIPPGETRSYRQIAERIGRPGAARAVGQACGRNPIPILVPCHRVVASGGKLGGYSGGLHFKEALLAVEGKKTPVP